MLLPPAPGRLLIAEPFLGDPNFERSVVLICDHNDTSGTFGLVLNQPTQLRLLDIWEATPYSELPVYIGGPVQPNTLHCIHRLGNEIAEAQHIGGGIYWGGDYEEIAERVRLGQLSAEQIRFFAGYSGWSEGQLAREITEQAWIVCNTEAETIFSQPALSLWRSILKSMGGEYKAKSNYPIDPRLN